MAAKQMLFNEQAREAILHGVRTISKLVKATLGPRGHVVLLARGGDQVPAATKDGATVVREFALEDAYEDIGAQLVREVASRTSDLAGDGTSTATVYAEAIFAEGLKRVTAGARPEEVKRGISQAVAAVTSELGRMARRVGNLETLERVATCSANHDVSIGQIAAEAVDKVGADGQVVVEDGSGIETTVELLEGMRVDRGYLSPHFMVQGSETEVVLEDASVLLYDKAISNVSQLAAFLGSVPERDRRLLIVADEIGSEALALLVVNVQRGGMRVCAIKSPGFGEQRRGLLEDLAVFTGARPIRTELGLSLEDVRLEDLGRARKVVVGKDTTTVVQGAGKVEDVTARIDDLRRALQETTAEAERHKIQERIARLEGKVARIRLGGATESEVNEKRGRMQDAIRASQAAMEEGVLPGGGVAAVKAGRVLDRTRQHCEGDECVGVDVISQALAAPLFCIAQNAGVGGRVAVGKVLESEGGSFGFNALTGEYGDLVEMGVLVPAKVERIALEQAASIASLLLTTDVIVAEVQPK